MPPPLWNPTRSTSRNHPLCLGSLLFGEFYLDLDLLHTKVCNSIQLIGLFPSWNSIPCKSISHKEFYSWSLFLVILLSLWIGPTRTTGVYLVCVCLPSICLSYSLCSSSSPLQISWIREDRATLKGSPLIIWYQQLLVATDLLLFVISTINFKNPKNSPKIASNFDL
jgi:hypothetical protein